MRVPIMGRQRCLDVVVLVSVHVWLGAVTGIDGRLPFPAWFVSRQFSRKESASATRREVARRAKVPRIFALTAVNTDFRNWISSLQACRCRTPILGWRPPPGKTTASIYDGRKCRKLYRNVPMTYDQKRSSVPKNASNFPFEITPLFPNLHDLTDPPCS